MKLGDILHVAIRTMDLEATKKFYGEVLGLQVDEPAADGAGARHLVRFFTRRFTSSRGRRPMRYADGYLRRRQCCHFRAAAYDAWRVHLEQHGCDYRQNTVKLLANGSFSSATRMA